MKLREEIQEFTLKKISYILYTVQKTNVDNLIICTLTIKNYCFKLLFFSIKKPVKLFVTFRVINLKSIFYKNPPLNWNLLNGNSPPPLYHPIPEYTCLPVYITLHTWYKTDINNMKMVWNLVSILVCKQTVENKQNENKRTANSLPPTHNNKHR